MKNGNIFNVPISVTKEKGLFVATCKMFNIKVKGRTELETKMNFVNALHEALDDVFKYMILKKKTQAHHKEEEAFSMAL